MVFAAVDAAASPPRSPRPTRTSGLANRLAAPFAQRIFLAYPLATAHRREVRASSAGRSRRARGRSRRTRRARSSSCPQRGAVLGVFGALAGATALNEFVVDTWGAGGPPILHLTGRRDYDLVRARVQRDDYRVLAGDGAVRRGALRRRPRARALGGRRSGRSPPPAGPRSSSRIRSRRATTRRRTPSTSCARAARSWCASSTSTTSPSSCARCSTIPRGSRGWARRCCAAAKPNAADEIADELVALAGR